MIDIRCSKLEDIRNRPDLHGKLLALKQVLHESDNGPHAGGMNRKWKSSALEVHHGATINPVYTHLENALSNFTSKECKDKKQFYLDSFISYFQQLQSNKCHFKFGNKQVAWTALHPEVRLTGHAPWIIQNGDKYNCYFIVERLFESWKNQLKYPLLQQYIAGNILKCDSQDVVIGIYSIMNQEFDLQQFSKKELVHYTQEAKDIFAVVHESFTTELKAI